MTDFDRVPDRRGTGSNKWSRYEPDVLPLWVADTDFPACGPVLDALRRRLEHPVFGYASPDDDLREAVAGHFARAHGWRPEPARMSFVSGVVTGFNLALNAFLRPGDGVVVETPVYPPIRQAPGHWGLERIDVPLVRDGAGWALDDDRLADAMRRAKAILLCSPQNPTGKRYRRAELERIAELALAHDVLIVSDEIHCDLVLDGGPHVPIASLSPEVEARTVTLVSASKAWNVAGLKCSVAVVPDALRARFEGAKLGLVDSMNVFGLVASRAAFAEGGPWLAEMIGVLRRNRDHLAARLAAEFPGIRMAPPEATYLAWLDCSGLGLDVPAQRFLLEEARVALNCGTEYGAPGHWTRLNFGCPQATLDAALDRMKAAIGRTARAA